MHNGGPTMHWSFSIAGTLLTYTVLDARTEITICY